MALTPPMIYLEMVSVSAIIGSRSLTLFKSSENLSIDLKVFAPNAFPLDLSPT